MKYNTVIKRYPNGYFSYTISDHLIKDDEYTPPVDTFTGEVIKRNVKRCKTKDKVFNYADSTNRARSVIFDSIMLNDFQIFGTLTFDDNKINAKDIPLVMKKLSKWLNNQVQRKDLHYILVPEYHKSGRVHVHFLCNDVFTLVDSGTVIVHGMSKPIRLSTYHKFFEGQKYQPVYNLPEWKYGFSTAIRMYFHEDDLNISQRNFRVANYICCYITKECSQIFGKYYWSSKNIIRRPEIEYQLNDFDAIKLEYENNINGFRYKKTSNFIF